MTAEFKQESRARWAAGAAGWEKHAEAFNRATMPVSTWMVEAIAPQPGHTVLDLGAGPGDPGFLAAELIQPGGTLICSDVSPEMLSVAQRRAERLGLTNVRFRQIDAETIDQPAASLDGVLGRWVYMLASDGDAALRESRRVLRSGGRLALAAWTAAEENPWSSVPVAELVARGLVEAPDPSLPGQFAWAGEGVVAEHLEAAGIVDYQVDVVEFAFELPSPEVWWARIREMSHIGREAAARMDAAATGELVEALREAAAPWTAPDGSLSIPARTWVAAASV